MNNELVKQLIEQAGFSRTYELERTRKFIKLVVLKCSRVINYSSIINYQNAKFTSASYLINHFGIKQY
jgi:hypothetical protein